MIVYLIKKYILKNVNRLHLNKQDINNQFLPLS